MLTKERRLRSWNCAIGTKELPAMMKKRMNVAGKVQLQNHRMYVVAVKWIDKKPVTLLTMADKP